MSLNVLFHCDGLSVNFRSKRDGEFVVVVLVWFLASLAEASRILFVLAPEEPFSKRNRICRGSQHFQSWQKPPQRPHSTAERDSLARGRDSQPQDEEQQQLSATQNCADSENQRVTDQTLLLLPELKLEFGRAMVWG